jgi:hypothetical protein
MAQTVGVEFDGFILVVGFIVTLNAEDTLNIYIESIARWDGESIEDLGSPDEAQCEAWKYANSERFRIRTFYAIADYNGQNFDPETFRRMN